MKYMGEWVGTREAAEQVGVTLRSLYRFIDEGSLPAYKMGRVIRLRSEDLATFCSKRPGSAGLVHPDPDHDDPDDGLSGVREPRRPRPFEPCGGAELESSGQKPEGRPFGRDSRDPDAVG